MKKTKIAKINPLAIVTKKIFSICENNEGINGTLHIIENTDTGRFFPEEKLTYRIYSAKGYCFDVTREQIELAEDESNEYVIGEYEYSFNSGYEGFKEIEENEALALLKNDVN